MTLIEAITVEITMREQRMIDLQATIDRLRGELDELAAMKARVEGWGCPETPDATAADPPASAVAAGRQGRSPRPAATRNGRRRPARGRTAATVRGQDATTTPQQPIPPANGRAAPGERDERVIAAVTALEPATVAQISEHTGLSRPATVKRLQRLVRDGRIVATGATKARRYLSVQAADQQVAQRKQAMTTGASRPLPALTRDTLAAITRDPGLTEPQLAQALNLDREDIAVACGELLDQAQVQRDPRGGYTPHAPAEIAERERAA